MSNDYDPWQHNIHIFFKRIFQFIGLTIFLGFLTWYAWLHFYFEIGIWDATKQIFKAEPSLFKALFTMCFIIAATITSWLFTWLMRNKNQKGDNHYRGSHLQNY